MAWLLTLQVVESGHAATGACLSMAAELGFRAVAADASTARAASGLDIEAQAMRLGMRFIVVNDGAHYRLGARLDDTERWAQAQALSREGFDGFILCDSGDSRTRAESLLATARSLLRHLDQLDWESYQ